MEGDEASGQHGLKIEAGQQASPGPAPAQLREDQVQNAVSFLSHPKVRGSPKASKVSFLQQKGLTEAEIEEAFRRVPDTPVPSAPSPAPPAPSSVLATTASHLAPQPYPVPTPHLAPQQPPPPPPLRWSQVALGAGFAAAGAYAVKSLVWPFVADKYAAWRGRGPAPGGAPPPDVAAVADAIRAQTAEMAASIAALKELVEGLDARRRPGSPEDHVTAAELRAELRAIAASLNEIAGPLGRTPAAAPPPPPLGMESELSEIKAMLSEYLKTPRSGAATPPGEPGATPGTHRSAAAAADPVPPPPPSAGRHPASYMEVLEMLERGETPPGIRDDINDKPPNPHQPPPPSRMAPPPKPWELRAVGGDAGREGSGGLDLSPVLPEDGGSGVISGGGGYPQPRAAPESASSNGAAAQGPSPAASPRHELRSAGRGAASIFEAATSSKGSPGLIAGRLSPSEARRRGIATPTALFADPHPSTAAAAPPATTTAPEEGSEGSGLGRPSSRGWRPPPIPVPTLSTGSTGEGRGWRGGDGGGGSGAAGEATPGNASYASLGAEFHSA